MFYSIFFKKHYPIKNIEDLKKLSEKEIRQLSCWVLNIDKEIRIKNLEYIESSIRRHNYKVCKIYNTYSKDISTLVNCILNKDFDLLDIEDFSCINNVLFRHKYNLLFSFFFFPVNNNIKDDIESSFIEEKEFLSEEEYCLLIQEETKNYSRIYKEFVRLY